MVTEISLEQQVPPHPGDGDDSLNKLPPRLGFLTNNRTYRRMRVWTRFLRMRLASAILLPELSPGESRELRQSVREDGRLTRGYVLMCGLSAGIAMLGMLQGSTAVVIGAMLISPLMSPIAGLGFGFASLDGNRIREAARVVAVGAGIGILVGVLLTWISPIRNATPEILARTQPTLLDLAVALFSGIAGGYATVIRKGGTAIGVAIATALMPPLAVVGYGIGVLQIQFALGAFLLFLTNLAAITFSFALIARLSNAARPLYQVEWRPRYIVVFVATFLVLAIPLTMTLVRITQEAKMRSTAREAIVAACGGGKVDVAQLEVSWPLFDDPTVDALVIAPTYTVNAENEAERILQERLGESVMINLQQVQAADLQSQTRAMIDAAMERTTAGIAADVPPYDKIRASIGLPARALWTNRAERRVYIEPIAAPDWSLADYREIEKQANSAGGIWNVRVVPPPVSRLKVTLGGPADETSEGTVPADLAVWALKRWGLNEVQMQAPDSDETNAFVKALRGGGVTVALDTQPEEETGNDDSRPLVALVNVYAKSPTARAAAVAAAKAKAEAAAKEKAEELAAPRARD